ncbi:glycosyltransferase family 4 protein [Candidatus Woesearchaeota archaeon]|nr:glycosyltransferase family 4 protein [Candidatus Woesearchaeota archaeon]
MKIAILTPTFSPFSGIDRLVEGQAERFIAEGHHVDIFTFDASLKPKQAGLFVLGMPRSPFLQRIYRLLFFLDRDKIRYYVEMLRHYDRIISHLYPMNLLAAKAKKINPELEYVYYNAGVGIVPEYSFPERIYLKLFNYLNNRTVRNCDSAISISAYLRGVLKEETGIDSSVEPIPVDKARFNPRINGARVRKQHGIGNGPVLLYVGRISPHKGIHLLIDAFRRVEKAFPGSKLLVVGKHTFPGYSRKLHSMADENVIFAGFVPDEELPGYYGACDLYVTASLWEGFDIPVVEAQACGKKVVAFDLCSHPEVIKKGVLVRPRDIQAFAESVNKLLQETKKFK